MNTFCEKFILVLAPFEYGLDKKMSVSSVSPSTFSESDHVLDISDEEATKKERKVLALEKVLDPNLQNSWPKWFLKAAKSQLKKLKIKPEATETSEESDSLNSEASNEVSIINTEEEKKITHDFLITQEHKKNQKNRKKFVLTSFNLPDELKHKPLEYRILAALTELDPITGPSLFKLVKKESCKKMNADSEKLIYFETTNEHQFAKFLSDFNVNANPCPSEIIVQTKLSRLDGIYHRSSDEINSHPSWVSNNGINVIFFSTKTQNWVIGRNSSIGVNHREFLFKSDTKTKWPSDANQGTWSSWSTSDSMWIACTSIKIFSKKKLTVGMPNYRFSRFTTKTTRVLKR